MSALDVIRKMLCLLMTCVLDTRSGMNILQGRFGNVYYHFNIQCALLHCSLFDPSQLEIPTELFPLERSHKDRLSMMFGIDVA